MDVRSIILGFLMQESMTGYELRKFFSVSFSFFSGLSYGSIYPALKRLESEGLITMELKVQDGSPNRKVYTITEKGREEFLSSIREPIPFEQQRYNFLMHLFFFSHLPPEERVRLAEEHLRSVEEVRESLEAVASVVEAGGDRFQLMTFRFGLRFFSDLCANVRDTFKALAEGDHESGLHPGGRKRVSKAVKAASGGNRESSASLRSRGRVPGSGSAPAKGVLKSGARKTKRGSGK
jgi:DNA-binding PadR family transcriptional regulator